MTEPLSKRKMSFAPLWRLWERKVLQPRHLKQIRMDQDLPPDRLRRLQEKRLSEILRHAAAHVPHYRECLTKPGFTVPRGRALDELKKMPILEKKMIQQAPDRFVSQTASLRGAMRWHTSGSSGIALTVITNPEETAHSRALVRYGFLESGARSQQKILHIRSMTPPFSGLRKNPTNVFQWHMLDLKNTLAKNVEVINELRPEIVYSFPSYLSLLSQYILDHGLKVSPAYRVLTFGETLTPAVRDLVTKVFGCPVRDTYGSAEFHRIAYECSEGKLHVIESSVIVETLPDSGAGGEPKQEGQEILVTSLYHKTMPLIRYRIGDRAVFLKGQCRCGKQGMVLDKIVGRDDDFLTLPSGRRISARAINALDEIPCIMEYQIVQKKPDLFEVLVRPMSGFGASHENQIKQAILAGCCGETVRVEVRKVADIQRSSIGKLQCVVSEVSV